VTDHQRARAIERADLLLIRAVRAYQAAGLDDERIAAYVIDHLLPFLARRDAEDSVTHRARPTGEDGYGPSLIARNAAVNGSTEDGPIRSSGKRPAKTHASS